MPAFNARLEPKMLFGFPLATIIGLVVMLASGLLTFLLSSILLNLLTSLLFVYGFLTALVSMIYGADLKFFPVKRLSKLDQKSNSVEITHYE